MPPPITQAGRFSHEALFYAGTPEFAARLAPFVREGVANGEPVLVMVTADKIELLRGELGGDAAGAHFADMAQAGRNPGRIISAWSDFAARHEGRTMRGIGEPIWAGRSTDELVECQHHESLLNLAFDHAGNFRLVCPYDTEALPPEVIAEALRSHPLINDGALTDSGDYRGLDAIGMAEDPLAPPRTAAFEMGFQAKTLRALRRFVADHAAAAGLGRRRVEDLLMTVNEAATNSVRHGGGQGVARLWTDDATLICEIRDRGRIREPLVGRRRPAAGTAGGHGLWLAHQLCDLVQLRSLRSGTVVRLHMALAASS
jgi:anti-sigma regulatory factor (Ser/Thr protein kinase)